MLATQDSYIFTPQRTPKNQYYVEVTQNGKIIATSISAYTSHETALGAVREALRTKSLKNFMKKV